MDDNAQVNFLCFYKEIEIHRNTMNETFFKSKIKKWILGNQRAVHEFGYVQLVTINSNY